MYDGIKLPFHPHSFDKIISVNTLYFWNEPLTFINQLCALLKKDGELIIAFADKEFMKSLPFVKDRFTLYSSSDLKQLYMKSDFNSYHITSYKEKVRTKTGDLLSRKYHVFRLS